MGKQKLPVAKIPKMILHLTLFCGNQTLFSNIQQMKHFTLKINGQVIDQVNINGLIWCLVFNVCLSFCGYPTIFVRHMAILPGKFKAKVIVTQIAKFMGPTWGPPGSCQPQMGPMLAPWTLLSGQVWNWWTLQTLCGGMHWLQRAKNAGLWCFLCF